MTQDPSPDSGRPRSSRSLRALAPENRAVLRPEGDGRLVIPSGDQLKRMLDGAEDVESLMDLDSALSACLALARRKKVEVDRLAETACCHIRARRKAGTILMQTVARGGDRSKSHAATLKPKGLPVGVDKHLARRCRQLAAVPEPAMEEYFANSRLDGRVPTESGVIALLNPRSKTQRNGRGRQPSANQRVTSLPEAVLETVERFLGAIDVCVGGSGSLGASKLSKGVTPPFPFSGTVFVEQCDDVACMAAALDEMRLSGSVTEAVIVLRGCDLHRWRKPLSQSEWVCCLLGPESGCSVIAYHGERTHGFALIFSEVGLITRTV